MRPPTLAAVSPTESFIHHVGVFASDHAASSALYTAVLAPLGIRAGYRADGVAEYWHPERGTPSLSLETALDTPTRGAHIAFAAPGRAAVDASHTAAATTGAPRHWPEYRAYCAFVSDPDGNNIEAVYKERVSV
jgi:catechol 2,3-dioxygenase-like lactoylglutathione lyase family enzyme